MTTPKTPSRANKKAVATKATTTASKATQTSAANKESVQEQIKASAKSQVKTGFNSRRVWPD